MFSLFHSTIKVKDSGILQGFSDFHSHLLPAVDDGFKTEAETFKTLSLLEQSGVKAVWFTPHIMEDFPNSPDDLRERFDKISNFYAGKLELHLAAEHMIDGLFQPRLEQSQIMMHQENQLLIETSYFNPPLGLDSTLERLQGQGIRPLLAHPERYIYMTDKDYLSLHQKCIRFQLNLPSLVGAYGEAVRKKAEKLLSLGLYSAFGLDLHSHRQLEIFLESKISKKIIKYII